MLHGMKFSLFVLLVPLILVGTALAVSSAGDAQALVEKAVAYVKANGKDKAVAAFNNPCGGFVIGDLYIFMFDFSGVTLAHGADQKLVGQNLLDLKDADGKAFVKEFMHKVKSGGGWVDYHWTNPKTKRVQAKTTYVKGIDGTDYFVGCGIYK